MTVCTRDPVPFYDSEDDTKVYTHRHTFTEKLLPFLLLGGGERLKQQWME